MSRQRRTICYRCPTARGAPVAGEILMGTGPRVRRAYRILSAVKVKSAMVMLGACTWRLAVEPMSAALLTVTR